MDTPIGHTCQSQAAQENCGDSCPAPIRRSLRGRPNSWNSDLPALLISPFSQLDQFAGAFGAFQDVEVFGIREV